MRRELKVLALFTCITAATAFGSQTASANYGMKGEHPEARAGQEQKRHGHQGERFFKRMAKELGLSDRQKIEAKALFEAGRAKHKPLHDALRAERHQLQTLVHSGSADEGAIRAEAAKVASLESDLAVQRAQQARQFRALLTQEQAAKLKEMKGKHKDAKGFEGCQEGPRM